MTPLSALAGLAARLRHRRARADGGYTTPFWIMVALILLSLLAGVVDGTGRANASAHADDIATEAARAGTQQIDPAQAIPGEKIVIDPEAAVQAARAYLNTAQLDGTVTVNDTGTRVSVTVSDTYHCLLLGAVGMPTLAVSGRSSASLVHQVGD